MRGSVEIISESGKVLHKQDNMLVDGASELITDILTVNPALSAVETDGEFSASSILDASNYTIHAISFGKAHAAYQHNAHNSDFGALPLNTNPGVSGARVIGISGEENYTPSDSFPATPSPNDTRLEVDSLSPIETAAVFPGLWDRSIRS